MSSSSPYLGQGMYGCGRCGEPTTGFLWQRRSPDAGGPCYVCPRCYDILYDERLRRAFTAGHAAAHARPAE